ncbi:MAG: hypothetical protein F9K16_01195 [Thermoanaerobaculia bacterium]|nr:MAG: hypothetical protein F9K16_01195 [Thermoanaerobaculia bacterium]MBZ0102597.1 hypothetical protein [Thermoanaerobaculia bacterium]
MRKWLGTTLGLAMIAAACGGGQEPVAGEAEKEARETIRRARSGEKIRQTDSGLDPCAILRTGMVAEVFGVDAAALTFTAGSSRHPLCTARWRKPDADRIEAEAPQQMMDYMKRRMEAQQKGQPFDEKMPSARTENEASLTINDEPLDGAADAVARLEQIVAQLGEGITTEVRGRQHTTRVVYDDWTDGVGDRAAWAPGLSQLSVASNGVIFHVGVSASPDAAENRAKAIELARRVAQAL